MQCFSNADEKKHPDLSKSASTNKLFLFALITLSHTQSYLVLLRKKLTMWTESLALVFSMLRFKMLAHEESTFSNASKVSVVLRNN